MESIHLITDRNTYRQLLLTVLLISKVSKTEVVTLTLRTLSSLGVKTSTVDKGSILGLSLVARPQLPL